MEMICGPCSIEKGMPKEERMKLALSRIPNEKYGCPICGVEHSFQENRKTIEGSTASAKPPVAEPVKKAKKKKHADQEQLQLF